MTFASRETSVDDGRPVELYEFSIGTTTWRYTSAPEVIVRGGNNYTPIPIARGDLDENSETDKASLKVTVARDAEVSLLFLTAAPSEIVTVSIFADHYGENDWQVVWKGRVANASFVDQEVEFHTESVFASLRRPGLRRTYQMQCPHVLYGAACGLNRATYAVEYAVSDLSANTVYLVYTAAKLNFDGVDAATTFTDSSGKTWTAAGNAQLDTAAFKYGTAALLLDGTGDYISTPSHADFNLAGGYDFTIEGWIYLPTSSLDQTIFSRREPNGTNGGYELTVNGTGKVAFNAWGAAGAAAITLAGSTTVNTGVWHHVAVARSGDTVRLFLNGVLEDTDTQAIAVVDAAVAARIGASTRTGAENYLNGWVDDFRFTQAKAQYTATFTPPGFAVTATNLIASTGYFAGGYASYTDPATGATSRHFITGNVGNVFTLASVPFGLLADATLTVYPGCSRDIVTCDSKFSNSANYGGTPYLPKGKNPFAGNRVF